MGVAARIALLLGIAALLWLERKRPLRKPVERGAKRLARNLALGAVTAATVAGIERPIVTRASRIAVERGWGLLPKLAVPIPLKTAIALALMDYTLYWWHMLLHRVPALWRTHQPHHTDRDLDSSTALRFHFTEFLASIPWRCAQIVLIGVGQRTLSMWQALTFAEVLFHHSNLRLPRGLEHALAWIVVTPRLHGIHHSFVREERDSNFSSGLTIWDRLHGTARFDIGRDEVEIGAREGNQLQDVTLSKTLALPFERT